MHKPYAYSMLFQYHANQGIILQIIKVKTSEDHLACNTMNFTDDGCRILYLSETDPSYLNDITGIWRSAVYGVWIISNNFTSEQSN
jgi:hypothetical protein